MNPFRPFPRKEREDWMHNDIVENASEKVPQDRNEFHIFSPIKFNYQSTLEIDPSQDPY